MLATKKTKAPVAQINNVEEPEHVAADHKETAWHKTKLVAAKGVAAAGFVARKIGHLAGSAAGFAKSKIAINNLRVALNKAYLDTGEKVLKLDEQNKLGAVKPHFSEELERIDLLKEQIKKTRRGTKRISFSN